MHGQQNFKSLSTGFAHSLLELHALFLWTANPQCRTRQLASHKTQNLPTVALNNGAGNNCVSDTNASSHGRLYKYCLYGRSIMQTTERFDNVCVFGGNADCDSVYLSLESM